MMKLGISLLLFVLFMADANAKRTDQIDWDQIQENLSGSSYEALTFERVVDGDTFIASGKRIRLWGMDAPEKKEPMYEISSKALELFLETGELECKFIEFDRYKRYVMHCYSGGQDLGATMVKTGFARDYSRYSGGFYKQEETFARDGKLGLWE